MSCGRTPCRAGGTVLIGLPMFAGTLIVSVQTWAQQPDRTRSGADAGDRFGSSLSAAGLVDSGVKGDMLIGAFRSDPNGSSSGRAYVHKNAAIVPMHQLAGAHKGDKFGRALAGISDVDGDGSDDLVIAAPGN